MRIFFKYLVFGQMVLCLISCDMDQLKSVSVDAEIQPYFDRFMEEGALRGVQVDLNAVSISARFSQQFDVNVAGSCLRRSNTINLIEVNRHYWNEVSDLEREFVIFHELGHCYLDR